MPIRHRNWSTPFSLLALALPLQLAHGQERAQDKRRWLSPTQEVSDDPRRIPAPPGPKGPDGTIVLRGGRVFDGTGAAARPATIVITRNRIAGILDPASTNWPRDARVIDVAGKTVMPGLIDMHTHLTYIDPPVSTEEGGASPIPTLRAVQRLRYFIESGITSVRDVASVGEVTFRLKEWVRRNDVVGTAHLRRRSAHHRAGGTRRRGGAGPRRRRLDHAPSPAPTPGAMRSASCFKSRGRRHQDRLALLPRRGEGRSRRGACTRPQGHLRLRDVLHPVGGGGGGRHDRASAPAHRRNDPAHGGAQGRSRFPRSSSTRSSSTRTAAAISAPRRAASTSTTRSTST